MVVCQLASNCLIGMGFNIVSSYTDGMPNCRLNGRMDGDEVAYYYYETTTVVRKSMVCELACTHSHERCDPIPFQEVDKLLVEAKLCCMSLLSCPKM